MHSASQQEQGNNKYNDSTPAMHDGRPMTKTKYSYLNDSAMPVARRQHAHAFTNRTYRALRTANVRHALSAGTMPGCSSQQEIGRTAGPKDVQQEHAGASAELRNTPLGATPETLASRKSDSRAASALSLSKSPEVQKATEKILKVSASPIALQVQKGHTS